MGFTVPKWVKDWRKRAYFGQFEVFETGMWYAKPNKYGQKVGVSSKMWYVPHLKLQPIYKTDLEHVWSIIKDKG
jgi:hypothetical protein